jgi:hypothetical protein
MAVGGILAMSDCSSSSTGFFLLLASSAGVKGTLRWCCGVFSLAAGAECQAHG